MRNNFKIKKNSAVKLIHVTGIAEKFQELRGSLPGSQGPSSGLYPDSNEFTSLPGSQGPSSGLYPDSNEFSSHLQIFGNDKTKKKTLYRVRK
jgi:hypothetical protein